MSTTTETPAAGTDLELMRGLVKSMAGIEEKLKSPDFGRIHKGANGAESFWVGEDVESVAVPFNDDGQLDVRMAPELPKKFRRLPKGYKNGIWKSGGEFFRDLYRAHAAKDTSEFRTKYNGIFKAVQGMSEQVGSDGGYMVLPEFNQQIIERMYRNDIWQRTRQYQVVNNMVFLANAETSRANGSRKGGIRGYFVDEGASGTRSKPTFRRIELALKKMMILVYLTDELLEDTTALMQYITDCVAEEFNFLAGDSVFNGSGVGMPLGILNSPAFLSIAKETGQGAATIVSENIDKMWARRFTSQSYEWYHNQDCGPQLDRLAQDIGTGGVVLYRPENGIAGVMPQALKATRRNETEFNATLGTVGDLVLADLGQYITINRGGINQAVSTHVAFDSDQTCLRFTIRMNGRPWETTPVTPFKGSNTQASFLGLETRS